MKRTLIIGIMLILTLTGCGKEVQAETVISTTVAIAETIAPINMEVAQTVSQELAAQASKEIAEIESLEADGRIIYDDNSGDILTVLNTEETETHNGMQDALRRDVKKGDIAESEIAEYVKIICGDFLDEEKQKEFTSELITLIPKPAQTQSAPKSESKPSSKPAETKSSNNNNKPAETKAPTPTQSAPEVLPDPQVSDKIDTSGWNLSGGGEIIEKELTRNPTYSREQLDELNNIQVN